LRCAAPRCTGSFVLVATCNRVELYEGDGEASNETAEHLFRVAAGLESAMLGEKAVLGQVKRSYLQAVLEGHISSGLHRLFQSALRAGKRVRAETLISNGAVSYSQAAFLLLRDAVPEFLGKRVVVVGAHAMNRGIIELLKRTGCGGIALTNRTDERGLEMAVRLGCDFFRFIDLPREAAKADIIVSATSSPQPILTPGNFAPLHPSVIIDLAIPRDIDERIGRFPQVRLFNLEHVEGFVEQNRTKRAGELEKAEGIIAQEVKRFQCHWERTAVPC